MADGKAGRQNIAAPFPVGPNLHYGRAMKRFSVPSCRSALPGVLALACALTLSGCGALSDSLGLNKQPPDEFNVVTRAPLVMPPSLDMLPEPAPGMQRPQELRPQEQAMAVLFGDAAATTPAASQGEGMLLADARIDAAAPDIRETIDLEHSQIASEQSWMQSLQFWRDNPDKTAVVINPAAEQQRLQNNAALGRPANEGDFEGVIVETKEKALLEDIF